MTPDAAAVLDELLSHLRSRSYGFVTPTPATHARVLQRDPERRALNLTDIFGWSRPFDEGALPRALFERLRDTGIIVRHDGGWKSTFRVSTVDDHLFLHSAYPTLAADAVFLGPDTYRFARAIAAHLAGVGTAGGGRALDLGCGAGVGGILIAATGMFDHVVLSDINDTALAVARINAAAAGVTNTSFVNSNLYASTEGPFDLIVCNPPYLNDATRRAYRHGGGDYGSALSLAIAEGAAGRLAPGGQLVLYTGAPIVGGQDPFRTDVGPRLDAAGLTWRYDEIDPDVFGEELDTPAYQGVDRIAVVLVVARKPGERRAGHH